MIKCLFSGQNYNFPHICADYLRVIFSSAALPFTNDSQGALNLRAAALLTLPVVYFKFK